jgi:hypothetical protein
MWWWIALFGNSYNDDACLAAAILAAAAKTRLQKACKQHTELPWCQALPKLQMRQFGIIALLLCITLICL